MGIRIIDFNYPADMNISKIIKEKGVKQAYIAEKAGYTEQEMSDMLNGRKIIKICDVVRIAKTLDVKVDDICAAGEKR